MVLQNEETSSKKKLFKLCTNPDGGVRPFFQISLLGKLAHVYPPMRVIPFIKLIISIHKIRKSSSPSVLSPHSRHENHYYFGFATSLLVSDVGSFYSLRLGFRNKAQRSWSWQWLYQRNWNCQFGHTSFSSGSHEFRRNPMGSDEKLAHGQRYSEAKKTKKEAKETSSFLNHQIKKLKTYD